MLTHDLGTIHIHIEPTLEECFLQASSQALDPGTEGVTNLPSDN